MSADTMSGYERDKMILQKTGGPAFPAYGQGKGMSLRDWFAGQALAGLLANTSLGGTCEDFAADAYKYAAAMLEGREANDVRA